MPENDRTSEAEPVHDGGDIGRIGIEPVAGGERSDAPRPPQVEGYNVMVACQLQRHELPTRGRAHDPRHSHDVLAAAAILETVQAQPIGVNESAPALPRSCCALPRPARLGDGRHPAREGTPAAVSRSGP